MFEYFNTVKGIESVLSNLNRLRDLITVRQNAYKKKKQKLNEFVIYGRLLLSNTGGVHFISEITNDVSHEDITDEVRKQLPPVVSMTTFKKHLKAIAKKYSFHHIIKTHLPNVNTVCPFCHKGWTLNTVDNFVTEGINIPAQDLKNQVGHRIVHLIASDLAAVTMFVELSEEKINDILIHHLQIETNDLWSISRDRETRKIKNYFRMHLYHSECYRQYSANLTYQKIVKALTKANIDIIGSIRVKNEYGSEEWTGPWYIFDTNYGLIKIGYRKKVINLDFQLITKDYLPDGKRDNVTHGPGYIHAWGVLKLTEYLKDFVTFMQKDNNLIKYNQLRELTMKPN